jgi:hypothetical protein
MSSITQLLLPTVPKIFGICQHQLILTPVDYVYSFMTELLNRCGKVYSNTTTLMNLDAQLHSASPQTMHLRLASPQSFKSAMELFSTICSFGFRLSFMAHSLQEKVTLTLTSTFLNAINSYHRVNTLYNRTINCFSTLAQSSIALDKTFSYNQALKQDHFCEFIKVMMVEVSDHESISHWTLTKHCNLPP